MSDITVRVAVLLAALQQFVVPGIINPFDGSPSAVRGGTPSQIEPAGYAFAIWGLIYLGALAYGIWQLLRPGRQDPLGSDVAPYAIVLYLGSSLWLVAAKYGPLWLTIPILGVMAICAVSALRRIAVASNGGRSWLFTACVTAPFALYAGWTVCATFVNFAEVAPRYGFDRFGLSVSGYAVLSLCLATLVVALVLRLTRGNPVFGGTVVWALVAIIVAGQQRGADMGVIVTAIAGIAVVLSVLAVTRSRQA